MSNSPFKIRDDRPHLVIGQRPYGPDEHGRIGHQLFEFGKLGGVMVSDELYDSKQEKVNTLNHGTQVSSNCLMHDEDLVVHIHGKIVCLHDKVILGVHMCRQGNCCCCARVGLIFFDFLSSK